MGNIKSLMQELFLVFLLSSLPLGPLALEEDSGLGN